MEIGAILQDFRNEIEAREKTDTENIENKLNEHEDKWFPNLNFYSFQLWKKNHHTVGLKKD